MSESEGKDSPPKPFSAFAYESQNDPDTLSLSDSDPALSDEAEVTSLSPGEEEDDDEEDVRQEGQHKPSVLPFTLKGTNAGFSQRSHGIFGGLLDLQKNSPLGQQNRKREVADNLLDDIKGGKSEQGSTGVEAASLKPTSKSTTSAKPLAPSGRLPDYLAHPERWTKYSLENVPDTSDRTNRNTALTFLTELKQQKEAKEVPKETSKRSYNQDSSSSGEGRILFSKPTKKVQQSSEKSGLHSGSVDRSETLIDEGQDETEDPEEAEEGETLGFHGVKKRVRKNFRPKTVHEDEGEAS
ncbi:U5 small nuclear ribonucleoprotein TSSC4 isoform 1-T4 [Anomaloglossus baeobatrachus]|uniref:U5 small nuclear ribonucleoprotein TSSC4 n=1 Tax=Anomaloglossus baeobatrachus TaxID=238106 RepID=UPI003F508D65